LAAAGEASLSAAGVVSEGVVVLLEAAVEALESPLA
jgi:hypothetical protein